MHEDWLRQTPENPLYPDIEWARPQNRQGAGKLLIIGGSSHSIAAPIRMHTEALRAGAGSIHVILPDSTRRIFHALLQHAEDITFAGSNPSGGFALQALGAWLSQALWADHVLFAGDMSKNSETAIVFERFCQKYQAGMTITGDALDTILGTPELVTHRDNTTIAATLQQLQRFAINARTLHPVYQRMGIKQLAESMKGLSSDTELTYLTDYDDQWIVARHGTVVTSTKREGDSLEHSAARVAVGATQNPSKWLDGIVASLLY